MFQALPRRYFNFPLSSIPKLNSAGDESLFLSCPVFIQKYISFLSFSQCWPQNLRVGQDHQVHLQKCNVILISYSLYLIYDFFSLETFYNDLFEKVPPPPPPHVFFLILSLWLKYICLCELDLEHSQHDEFFVVLCCCFLESSAKV